MNPSAFPGPVQLFLERFDPLRERVNRLRDGLPDRRRGGRPGDDLVAAVYRVQVHGASRVSSSGSQVGPASHEECSDLT